MWVGRDMADSALDHALSQAAQFGLTKQDAAHAVRAVATVAAGRQAHFAMVGVSPSDIAHLVAHIDRPFLREQRQAWQQ